MTWKHGQRVSCLVLLAVIAYGVYSLILNSLGGAQEKGDGEKKREDSFEGRSFISLRDERDTLEKEIRDIEKEGDILLNQKNYLTQEATLQVSLKEAESRKDSSPYLIKRLKDDIRDKHARADTIDTLDQVNKKIEQNKDKLKNKNDRKDKIETQLSKMIDLELPKQTFKTQISLYFTILIALVILGFFVVAWEDESVRSKIFSGESGIQFITLFSLVIAIILFGILGILEGKELAALLGGLSGYILGKGTSGRTESTRPMTPVLSSPTITDISPKEISVGATETVEIVGHGLQLANSVKIVQGAKRLLVSDITSNDLLVTCKVTAEPNQPTGKHDIIVTNSDGAEAKLLQKFEVK